MDNFALLNKYSELNNKNTEFYYTSAVNIWNPD